MEAKRGGWRDPPGCKILDKAAGKLSVREAGGVASGWPGRDPLFDPGLIAGANRQIYDELIRLGESI